MAYMPISVSEDEELMEMVVAALVASVENELQQREKIGASVKDELLNGTNRSIRRVTRLEERVVSLIRREMSLVDRTDYASNLQDKQRLMRNRQRLNRKRIAAEKKAEINGEDWFHDWDN